MWLYLSSFFPYLGLFFPFSHSRVQYFKLLDILSSSHIFKGSCHACVGEETFIERSKYLLSGRCGPTSLKWVVLLLSQRYLTKPINHGKVNQCISLVLLIVPHPVFLIGHIVSLTIRAAISSYTLPSFFSAFFSLYLFFLLSPLHSPSVSMLSMNLHPSFFLDSLLLFAHFGYFFFMISETAGLGGLLRQLSDHQDLTVEEECQRRLRVQRVWPLSEAALGKGGN